MQRDCLCLEEYGIRSQVLSRSSPSIGDRLIPVLLGTLREQSIEEARSSCVIERFVALCTFFSLISAFTPFLGYLLGRCHISENATTSAFSLPGNSVTPKHSSPTPTFPLKPSGYRGPSHAESTNNPLQATHAPASAFPRLHLRWHMHCIHATTPVTP